MRVRGGALGVGGTGRLAGTSIRSYPVLDVPLLKEINPAAKPRANASNFAEHYPHSAHNKIMTSYRKESVLVNEKARAAGHAQSIAHCALFPVLNSFAETTLPITSAP